MSQAIIKTLTNAEGNETIYPRTTKEAVYGLGNIIYAHGDEVETEVSSEYLKSTPQELSDAQKAQARSNIGAVDTSEFNTLSNNVAYKTHLCNPNLLDNWYFGNPINQRGLTEYPGLGYSIDRWYFLGGGVITVENGYLLFHCSSIPSSVVQRFPLSFWQALAGRTVTYSILTDKNLYSATTTLPTDTTIRWDTFQKAVLDDNWYFNIEGIPSDNTCSMRIYSVTENAEMKAIAIKLELGDTQTLAHQENGVWVLNEIPNYADEMAKCAQYDPVTGEYKGLSSMKLLWENANAEGTFPAQTVPLDLSGYCAVVIYSMAVAGRYVYNSSITPVGCKGYAFVPEGISGATRMRVRYHEVTTTGIIFEGGTTISTDGYGTNLDNIGCPMAIYGIKGVL